MAGRNPDEAIRNYKAELQKAFKCLDCYSKIEFDSGRKSINSECAWVLLGSGDEIGITLPGIGGLFQASQRLNVIECERHKYGGPVRLTTTWYDYSLDAVGGLEQWAFHWHPNSASKAKYPHIHLRQKYGSAHLATGRLLIKHAIHWAIECGATARHGRWLERLKETIERHERERDWS